MGGPGSGGHNKKSAEQHRLAGTFKPSRHGKRAAIMSNNTPIQGKTMPIPGHLDTKTKKWFRQVCEEYRMEGHHIKLLTLAAEAWDRAVMAEGAIRKYGVLYVEDGKPRANPAIKIKVEAEAAFARLIRQLDLRE